MNESALILSAFENRLRAGLILHSMQINPADEQNKNAKWSESPWNQPGRRGKGLWWKGFARAKSKVQNERLNE